MSDPSPPASSSRSNLAGTLLADRYRLERLIATGGMAQVWEATDLVLDRRVAVKLLHSHLADDESFVGRFRREAIAAARLAHPSIVSIYDTYSGDGMEAIVMELVHGHTLRQDLDRRGALPPAEVVRIGSQVADALATAHHSKLVHRDIKPANILLCEDDRVMVADFGIAKLDEHTSTDHTKEGTMLGTAKYLAPEQVEGGPVDGRTDVYALGVVLYEMLCGRPPFVADSDAATALARLHADPPRPRQLRADLPRSLDDIVMRCLARDPEKRYGTAAELRAALLAAPLGVDAASSGATDHTVVAAAAAPAAPTRPPSGPAGSRTPPGGTPAYRREKRRWLLPTLLVLLVAIALGVAGVLIGRSLGDRLNDDDGSNGDGTSATSDPEAQVLTPTGAVAFDPEGGDGENDSAAPNVLDGNNGTTWATSTYSSPDFGNLKSGVGIFLTLEEAAALDQLVVNSPSSGWSAQVYVATDPGQDLASWGEPVTEQTDIQAGQIPFELEGEEGNAVLLWITLLDGSGRVEIADLSVA